MTYVYDVLFQADHFIMVTTVESNKELHDRRDTEVLAWERLASEYDVVWVEQTRALIKHVSVEQVADMGIPEPGDLQDAGLDDEEHQHD